MSTGSNHKHLADVAIVGSGIAGLLLALELAARNMSVVLLSKSRLYDSNTSHAQGGLAAVMESPPFDSVGEHVADTIKAGSGLADRNVVEHIVGKGPGLVRRLQELGVWFDRDGSGELSMAREGGHSRARVLHAKDATGKAIIAGLSGAVRQNERISIIENAFVTDLIVDDNRCWGLRFLHEGSLRTVFCGSTCLATGGIGQAFSRTTNPAVATGDGIAMAWRAGARLADMEFVQFHPTVLLKENAPPFLISEAVRGAGAWLKDSSGCRFVFDHHPDGELATRDVVSRAIKTTMRSENSENVWLDLKPIGEAAILEQFPNIVTRLRSYGIDPVTDPVPVSPAAHYFMGGIWTDINGLSTVSGLYALGECASVGLHGANRLASNSLLEGGVMAMRVADHIAIYGLSAFTELNPPLPDSLSMLVPESVDGLRSTMFECAGIERRQSLFNSIFKFPAADKTVNLKEHPSAELKDQIVSANLLAVGQLIARAASLRTESRGVHFRVDYPKTDDRWTGKHIYIEGNRVSIHDRREPVSAHRKVDGGISRQNRIVLTS